MKFHTKRFYIWTASLLLVLILFAAGFAEYMSYARKETALPDKPPVSGSPGAFVSGANSPFMSAAEKAAFVKTVKYLHYLRYLPLSYKGPGDYKFSFPVPADLLKTADSYEWTPRNPFFLGAIEQYLAATGKLRDGEYIKPEISVKLLSELKESASKNEFDPQPWKWVLVRQAMKGEKVELFENGRKVFSSAANTGEYATTPQGTWFVYLRYNDTVMSGLSPSRISEKTYESLVAKTPNAVGCLDGHPVKWVAYDDSGIKYVDYFNKGIALHYIQRDHYGFPQSAGCVELPLHYAKSLHKNIGYGTIVTVIGMAEEPVPQPQNAANGSSPAVCMQPGGPGALPASSQVNKTGAAPASTAQSEFGNSVRDIAAKITVFKKVNKRD